MTRKLHVGYVGSWLFVDWPFARLLSIEDCKDGDFKFSFYDIDCEVAEQIMTSCEPVNVPARPFEFVRAGFKRSGVVSMQARYSSSSASVKYVFHIPRGARMRAECSWAEDYVNCNANTSGKRDVPIVGKWRYALTKYSSLIMSVGRDGAGNLRLEVTDSSDNRRVRTRVDCISDSEVSFSLLGSGIGFRLKATSRRKAVCHCSDPGQTWVRSPSEISISPCR